jgi:hypothetical protein
MIDRHDITVSLDKILYLDDHVSLSPSIMNLWMGAARDTVGMGHNADHKGAIAP